MIDKGRFALTLVLSFVLAGLLIWIFGMPWENKIDFQNQTITIKHKGIIRLGDDYPCVYKMLGKPLREQMECGYIAMIYKIGDNEISFVFPEKDDMPIGAMENINIFSSAFKTGEGVRIGDFKEKVLRVYRVQDANDDSDYIILEEPNGDDFVEGQDEDYPDLTVIKTNDLMLSLANNNKILIILRFDGLDKLTHILMGEVPYKLWKEAEE